MDVAAAADDDDDGDGSAVAVAVAVVVFFFHSLALSVHLFDKHRRLPDATHIQCMHTNIPSSCAFSIRHVYAAIDDLEMISMDVTKYKASVT